MGSKTTITPRLVIIEGKDKGKVITLDAGTAVIGRSKGDILVHDPRISRSHVAIHFDDEKNQMTFTDLKSLNGTVVNGDTRESGELKDGDRLLLGNTLFDCQLVAASKEPSRLASAGRPAFQIHKGSGGVNADDPIFLPDNLPGEGRAEPQVMAAQTSSPASRKRNPLPMLRGVYLQIPRKTRLYSLCAFALVMTFFFSRMGSKPAGSVAAIDETANSDREIGSITDLQSKGHIDAAVAKAEAYQKQNPDCVALHLLLGDLYTTQAKYPLAMAAYQKVLVLQPAKIIVHAKLMRALLMGGMKSDASSENLEIERLLKEKLSTEDLSPESREFFVAVGNLWLDFRELEVSPKKLIVMGQALVNVIAPKDIIGLKLEAVGQILQGVPEAAVTLLETARQKDPKDQSVIQYLVFAKVKLGDLTAASTIVNEWTEKFPDATQPLLITAHWKFESKDFAGALPLLQKVVALASRTVGDSTLPESLYLLGRVYRELGQAPDASMAFKESCEKGFATACDTALNNPIPKTLTETPAAATAAPSQEPFAAPTAQPAP